MGFKPVANRSIDPRLPSLARFFQRCQHVRVEANGSGYLGGGLGAAHWAAPPSASGHANVYLVNGFVYDLTDYYFIATVALQVL